jgi:glucose/arabinose dehydrogenase
MGVPDPDVKKPNPCAGVTLPVANMGAHSAVMGLHFYPGSVR